MLYLVGLGINGDITLEGLKATKSCDEILYEAYTSIIDEKKIRKIEELVGKKFRKICREDLEEKVHEILNKCLHQNICILIPGDPLVATTHISIILEAHKMKIPYRIIHNSSIFSSICEVGIQIYKIGQVVSIPLKQKEFDPRSFYDLIERNLKQGLHTLILLEAQDKDNFVSIREAIQRILELSRERNGLINENSLAVGIARLGFDDQIIKFGRIKEIENIDFGGPPHALIILGKLHFMEEEALRRFK